MARAASGIYLSQQHFMGSSTLNPGFLMLIGSGWITVCLDQYCGQGHVYFNL